MRKRLLPWTCDVEGTFAHRTLAVRVPRILDETVARLSLPRENADACAALRDELTHGALRGLVEDTPDRAGPFGWDRACAPHVGKRWREAPWYFAESFFYRRVLEATGFFSGSTNGADPFLPVKRAEEATVAARIADAPRELAGLLHASLWGNRADLSYTAGLAHGPSGTAADVLVDDTSKAVEAMTRATRIALLLDNAGIELAFDLLLASHLVSMNIEVTLWAKPQPFFVSDATPADIARTLPLVGVAALPVVTHPYLVSSGFFFQDEMPPDLVAALAGFDLVVVKGDANYRRLVGDAPWPHDTPLADVVDFPAPFVALRTLKAEVALGIARAPAERDWMTSGKYGVVQFIDVSGGISNGP